jgi:hypothetical protein
LKTCENKFLQSQADCGEIGVVTLQLQLKEIMVENRLLKEQLKQQEERTKQQEERTKQQEERTKQQEERTKQQVDRLNDQIFKLANRTTMNTTNTTILQRNNYLMNSLAPLDLRPDRIQKIIDENYTPERFKQGIEGAIQTINDIITDPDSGKRMHICTDFSRKKFVYLDEDEKKELRSDIGARMLIKSIKKPLSTAITKQYLDLINSGTLDQDKRDDLFTLHIQILGGLKVDTLSTKLAMENNY